MTSNLFSYQAKAVEYCVKAYEANWPGLYLAIDLGLGKTRICIEMLQRLKVKAIVFAPVQVAVSTWPDEFYKWEFNGSWAVAHGDAKTQAVLSNPDVLVLPYSSIKWFCESFQRLRKLGLKWEKRLAIFDEISMVKDPKRNRFKMLKQMDVLWHGPRIGMSATPRPNAAVNLWSQYYLLDKGKTLGKTQSAFHRTYCKVFVYPGTVIRKYTLREEMRQPLYNVVSTCTFRLDRKDHNALPDIIYTYITVELPSKVRKLYDKFEKAAFTELESGETEAFNAASKIAKLRQIIQGGLYYWPDGADETDVSLRCVEPLHKEKLKALKELIATCQGRSIICAVQFKFEIDVLRQEFPEAPIFAGGYGSAASRAKVISEWNNGEHPLLICHPASISHGLNLQQGGSIVAYLGTPWSLEQYSQLNGRVHRTGQMEQVTVYHILAKGSLDEAVLKALQHKHDMQYDLLNYLRSKHENADRYK